MEEPLDCLVGVFQVWGQNQDSYPKKSSHIRCDFSSSRQLEPTLFNTSLGFTAAVTGKLIIWKINDHIEEFSVTESTKDLFVSGIFGPLACSFLIASALQEPSSESRQFWSQSKSFFFLKIFVFIGPCPITIIAHLSLPWSNGWVALSFLIVCWSFVPPW